MQSLNREKKAKEINKRQSYILKITTKLLNCSKIYISELYQLSVFEQIQTSVLYKKNTSTIHEYTMVHKSK